MKHAGFAAFLLAVAAVGCEAEPRTDPLVPHEQIPAPAMQAVSKQMRGYRFQKAYKITVDGKEAYEIEGKDKTGDIRKIDVTPSGEILRVH